MTIRMILALTTAAATALPMGAMAESYPTTTTGTDQAEVQTTEVGRMVTLSGVIKDVTDDTFTLDYGPNTITVEMDGYDWYSQNPLLKGDVVVVRGLMDEDFFNERRVEASSVFVDSLNTYFYADPTDDEAETTSYTGNIAGKLFANENSVSVVGVITQLETRTDFEIDVGMKKIQVDASKLDTMPPLEIGDRVNVEGKMEDADLFGGREMIVNDLIKISN
jgi:uncharacterized protein YdeI (BOF family)